MRTTWQRLLERLASGDPIVGADDVRRWDKHDFGHAVALGVLRETEAASSVLCDACPERHWSEVIWVSGGRRAFIACPEEGTVDVEPGRLRQWRFDTARLAELLTEAMELTGPVQPIESGRLWHLGRRRLAGRFRDLFLAAGETDNLSSDFEKLLRYDGWTSGVVVVPRAGDSGVDVPPKLRVVNLCSVSRLSGERLTIDLDYMADCFTDEAPVLTDRVKSITAPAGAAWKEAKIILHDAFMQVAIRGTHSERDYAEAGFRDPDQRLVLLKMFGAARGVLDPEKVAPLLTGGTPMKKRISRLRQLLQELIEVDGDPIDHHKKANTYSCQFEIRLANDCGYPTPSGATWLDFAFHERTDSRLVVSAAETRRFRAHGQRSEDGRATGEAADEGTPVGRIYTLEELRLRTPGGKLTPEGTALLGLLRTGGRLPRRGDEITVLSLAKLLREWAGIEADPFQLSDAARSWTALFACSSEVRPAE
jgi:hypothetical protein